MQPHREEIYFGSEVGKCRTEFDYARSRLVSTAQMQNLSGEKVHGGPLGDAKAIPICCPLKEITISAYVA
jgi:hypothetical protein